MIRNFSDHAANERTFLAWVRSAIALMAFGFVVEKFDLFLVLVGHPAAGRASHVFGGIAGLIIMVLGIVMVALAAVRFVKTAGDIDSASEVRAGGARLDLVLAGLIFLLGCALFVYLAYGLFAPS
ncbi:MAG: YidH family protein [Caulobacteraceae bacterium]